jgi:hypothetical protein
MAQKVERAPPRLWPVTVMLAVGCLESRVFTF